MTSIVSLRRAEADDAERINAWRAEPSVSRYQPTTPYDLETMRSILVRRRTRAITPAAEGKLQWLILLDATPAGWVSLDITSRQSRLASVGYTVSEAFRGQRIASRGIREVLTIAFDPAQLALERLEANVAVENIASQRVLEGAGFQREGVARGLLLINGVRVDHHRYGLLAMDLPNIE